MTVNITLFVQMINFFIVYMLMKRLLINPFLHTKRHYEHDQQEIDQRYAQIVAQLAQAQEAKQQAWNNALKELAHQLPLKPLVPSLCSPTIQAYSLKRCPERVKQAAQRIAQLVLTKGT